VIEYVTELVENFVPVAKVITCDFCGITYGNPYTAPVTSFSINPGYGSCMDDDRYLLDICDRCLAKLLVGDEISLRGIK
jgi:hypothetical protein